jgi:hypothetical protein
LCTQDVAAAVRCHVSWNEPREDTQAGRGRCQHGE